MIIKKRNKPYAKDKTAYKLVGLDKGLEKISNPRKRANERSKKYYKIKQQDESVLWRFVNSCKLSKMVNQVNLQNRSIPTKPPISTKQSTIVCIKNSTVVHRKSRNEKFEYKRNVADQIAELNYAKFISKIADSAGVVFVKVCTDSSLSNDERNLVRVATKIIVSECLSQFLKEPLEVVNNIKMCVYVANKLYKLIVVVDKLSNKYSVDENSINEISTASNEYVDFVKWHPSLSIENQTRLVDNFKIRDGSASNGNFANEEINKLNRILEYKNNIANKICPECGGDLKSRQNHGNGKWFMGCENYFEPRNCKFTIDYYEFKDIEKEVLNK